MNKAYTYCILLLETIALARDDFNEDRGIKIEVSDKIFQFNQVNIFFFTTLFEI